MSDRVFILGAGRAGRGLARALRASGADVVGLHGRRARDAGDERITAGAIPDAIRQADVVLVTVRDEQLEGALRELAGAALAPEAVVLHASGSAVPRALDELRRRGHPSGTFHPLVPLADPERAPALLRHAWIGVDGDARAVAAGERLATRIGAHTLRIPPGEKARYHAAAVFASNFPTVLAAIAGRLLREAGVGDDEAWRALHGLMSAAVANLEGRDPAAALTGPVVRGDVETIRRHLDALGADPAARDVYVALTRAAVALARTAGADARRLSAIERLLG